MKVAAAEAIFSVVGDDLAADYIVPSPLDPRVGRRWLPPSRRPPGPELVATVADSSSRCGVLDRAGDFVGSQLRRSTAGAGACGQGDERFRDHVAGAALCRSLAVLRHAGPG